MIIFYARCSTAEQNEARQLGDAHALNAGVDVSLWDDSFPHLEEAVERGLVPEETLDKAVLRVLELKFARGLLNTRTSKKSR